MELIFLGTGAGMPTSRRNVSSIALRFEEYASAFWLFDCGEATQHRMIGTDLKLSKLSAVYMTHLHGDHVFGLPGLITSRANQGATTPLKLFGPKGLASYVETSLKISGSRVDYELSIIEITEERLPDRDLPLYEDEQFRIYCGRLDHRIECFGYRIEEKERPGKLDIRKLAEVGVPAGPLYGQLKKGETITLEDGTIVDGKQYLGPPIPGRVIAIIGDTRKSERAIELAVDADVLVHEATFAEGMADLAREYHHATTKEAAETAIAAKSHALIMTHISSRYQDEQLSGMLTEAQRIFPNTYMAEDNWRYMVRQRISKDL